MNEESLFDAALALPNPGERQAYLDGACGGDLGLRRRLDLRLAACDHSTGILDRVPADAMPAVGRIFAGRFKLRQKLGEGGMGEVWVADQTEPVQRRVAIKMIRPGLDSTRLLARFDQERQALALMDHPNVAKVLDAGVDGTQPYFVMDLIKGVPITEYCDAARLSPRQRLELFIAVCHAVQHAHQKGIIHRDLKPSNILVALYDGKPVPKVIDFGVAKATGPRLSAASVYTEVGALIGTVEYMSPEQAEVNNLDIDTRSDVYSLGVLLYELLTGTVPFPRRQLQEAAFVEMLRIIKEDQPPKPSTRLSSTETLVNVAAARQTPPNRLAAVVRGDLDWIVMKCLEKDRSRRYETARGLARDVERYISGEMVEARPPSVAYRVRKFVRRNRPQVIAAAAVLIALLAGGTIATWQAVRATSAEMRALADRDAKEIARLAEADARKDTRRQLWKSQLHRAAASTQGNLPGQRSASLAQLREALATAGESDVTEEDRRAFRDVAVAALGLPELEVVREWDGYPPGSRHLTADARLERYARSDAVGAVSVRRVADDRELYHLPGTGQPAHVSLSDDGRLLAVAAASGTGHVYRLDGPEPERLLTTTMDAIRTPHFTPDAGRLLFVADGAIRSWDRATGQVQSWALPGKPWGPTALSADGGVFAIGCDRDPKAVVHVRRLQGTNPGFDLPIAGPVEGMAWHPGGRILAVFVNRRIRLWDVPAQRELGTLDGHTTDGGQLAFDASGDRLFCNDWLGLLRVWDWRAGRQLIALPAGWSIYDRVASADGRHLLVHGPTQPTLRVVRCNPGRERQALGRPKLVNAEALADPRGQFILVGGVVGTVAVDPNTGEERGRLDGAVRPFHLTPAGELLTSGSHGPHWWPRTDDPAARVSRFGPPEWIGPAYSGAAETHGASTNGQIVAVPNHNAGAVVLHRGLAGVPALTGPQEWVRTAAVSPDGQWVATGSHDCPSGVGAKVWHARTGELVRAFRVPGLCPVSFSPDGRWLVTGGGGLRLWRVGTWDEGPRVEDAAAVAWTFTPLGDVLAIGGHGAVRLVRPADGTVLARLPLPGQGKFQPRCFAPDGGRLYVTELETGGVFVWDLRLLRQGLADLGLDWDAPPIPPTSPPGGAWKVEFVGGDRLGHAWDATVKAAWAAPTDVTVRTRLAAMATDPAVIRVHASLALVLDPKRADARYYRALANLRLKRYEEAAADAEAVLRTIPGHFDATRIRSAAEAALRTGASTRPPGP